MHIPPFNFQTFDWTNIQKEEHAGDAGKATWQIIRIGEIRVRMVEYSPGYKADHWCRKGHVLHCIEGEMSTELDDGRVFQLIPGTTYIVGDDCEAHRSYTERGCRLFIVD